MKKISIVTLLVICFWACTNDSESINVQQPSNTHAMRVGVDLQDLFEEMLKSQDYTTFDTSLIEFNKKLGEDAIEHEFVNETEMLDWIGNNLSKTSFNSKNHAISEWEVVKKDFELVLDSNSALVNGKWDENDGNNITLPEDKEWNEDYESYSDDPCVFGCINAAESARKAAERAYLSRMQLSINMAVIYRDIVGAALVATIATQSYQMDQSRIKRKLRSCSCGCNPIFC